MMDKKYHITHYDVLKPGDLASEEDQTSWHAWPDLLVDDEKYLVAGKLFQIKAVSRAGVVLRTFKVDLDPSYTIQMRRHDDTVVTVSSLGVVVVWKVSTGEALSIFQVC